MERRNVMSLIAPMIGKDAITSLCPFLAVHPKVSGPKKTGKRPQKGHKESELARMGMVCNRFNILRPSFAQTSDSLGMGPEAVLCPFRLSAKL